MSHPASVDSSGALAGTMNPGSATRVPLIRPPGRFAPPLGSHVHVPAGTYVLGEPGGERRVRLGAFAIGAWPVTTAHIRSFVEATGASIAGALAAKLDAPELADHPATDLTYSLAEAFCRWASIELGTRVRLPAAEEWEAAARGSEGRTWPWGDSFDPACCASAEISPGWTSPVTAHPEGASPFGAFDMAGNAWEWVLDATEEGGWRSCRGGSFLDHAWGVRASRSLPADPDRATRNTGFRLVFDQPHACADRGGWNELWREVW
ncbi:hypothetical protein BH20ACT24_BH20ACT24_17690 [soil metagenome]